MSYENYGGWHGSITLREMATYIRSTKQQVPKLAFHFLYWTRRMTNNEYLYSLLAQQALDQSQLAQLRSLRETIQNQLGALSGAPRFYYGGSFAKKTMIRDLFDLDIVIYWPYDCGQTLKQIFESVGRVLRKHWRAVEPKTVAWKLPFEGGFHIDVVPGRAIDTSFSMQTYTV